MMPRKIHQNTLGAPTEAAAVNVSSSRIAETVNSTMSRWRRVLVCRICSVIIIVSRLSWWAERTLPWIEDVGWAPPTINLKPLYTYTP